MGIFLVGVLAAHGVGDSGVGVDSKERMQAACRVEYCYEIILLILTRCFHPGSLVVRVQMGIGQLVRFVDLAPRHLSSLGAKMGKGVRQLPLCSTSTYHASYSSVFILVTISLLTDNPTRTNNHFAQNLDSQSE